jgi:hypothetical protein
LTLRLFGEYRAAVSIADSNDAFLRNLVRVNVGDALRWPNFSVAESLINQKETIMATFECLEDSTAILEKPFCVTPVSKNLKGDLTIVSFKAKKCKEPSCQTLRVAHTLKVKVSPTTCDSDQSKSLDGTLTAKLSTAFDVDGRRRGFHSGDFTWTGVGGLTVTGRMSGITNTGTHRKPIQDCQKCKDTGILEGRLCGEVVKPGDTKLKGCQVIGAYRIKFDPSERGGSGAVVGTIDGVIMCWCSKE